MFSIMGCERSITKQMIEPIASPEMPTTDDPEAFTIAFVQAAVDLYKTEGREFAIAYYNDLASVNGQWYVVIIDDNDIVVSRAVLPERIGRDTKNSVGSDGYAVGLEILKATEQGHWINYLWNNPESDKLELKRTWVIRYDGYVFLSGYYEPWHPDPATLPTVSKDDPEAFTVSFVYEAIARYEFAGVQATAAYYNDPTNIDGQWYMFITDPNDTFLAHAVRPDFIGTDLKDISGPDGTPVGREIAKATGGGAWIEYAWPNPESGEVELKRTWAIRHDGYLFSSGYYEPVVEDAMIVSN